MLKKIMSLALALVIVVSMFALPVDAAVGDYKFYESESNNSISTADRVSSGYTILGSVGKYDLDYYRFTLSSRSTVTLAGAASYSTIYMGINNSSDKVLYAYQPTYSGTGYSFAKSVTLNAGTYYLCVLSSNTVSYSKTYTLYLEYSAAAHTHSYSAATCTKPKTCTICGATSGSAAGHTYTAATCTKPRTCTVCGMTSGYALGHDYKEATCTEDETCIVCGFIGDPALGHIYAYDCDETCDRCGEERVGAEHIYADVCDTTCELCEAEREAPHSYVDACADLCELCGSARIAPHVFDNSCDGTCNACEFTREPGEHAYDHACDESCNICDEIRTTPGHVYSNECDSTCNTCKATREITHQYETVTVKATLSENGSVSEKCSVCDKVKSQTTIKYAKSFKLSTTEYTYNGESKKPSVTVTDSAGKKLKKDTDYTVSYPSGSKNVGKHKVTVKLKGKYSGTETLSFTVKPTKKSSASLLVGETEKIGAKSNTSIKYSSSNKDVASVSSKGTITAKKSGSATISVKSGDVTQKIKVTVKKPKVTVSGDSSVLLKGSTTLKAKTNCDAKVTWSSSDKKIATVSSSGKVTGKAAGTAVITAKITYKDKTYTDKHEIKVKKPSVSISGDSSVLLKSSTTLKAKTNCDAKVKWSTSDKKIATVSSSGKVTGVKAGKAVITAKITYKDKTYTDKFEVTVKKPYLKKTSASIYQGDTTKISVKGGSGTITYSTSNKSVATVSPEGVVTAKKKGTCTISVKRNGYSMTFKVTVKERDYSKTTLYEDSIVKISFKGAEKSKYDDDELEMYFFVENKTGRTRLIQADAVALNGYSFSNLTMSDRVSPYSTGIVNVSVNEFDFDLVNIGALTSIGAQFRVIDDANWSNKYDAVFAPTRLDGKGAASCPSVPTKKLLYSDSKCDIYYRNIEKSKYDSSEAELYLYLENKTNHTLLIQADSISVNGYSHSNLTMSDPVLSGTVGIVNVSINDFYYGAISLSNINTIGGQLRIINDESWSDSYKAVFTNVSVK